MFLESYNKDEIVEKLNIAKKDFASFGKFELKGRNLDYVLQSSNKPMMSFILENKKKNNRKDINDKETHIHGIREVFDEETDSKIRLSG